MDKYSYEVLTVMYSRTPDPVTRTLKGNEKMIPPFLAPVPESPIRANPGLKILLRFCTL